MPSYESNAGPGDGSGDGGSHQQHASNEQHSNSNSNSNSKNSKAALAKYSSLPLESQVCAEVLQHLATGTTPPQSNLLPTTPLTDSEDETSTNDQQAYKRKTDAQHHHLLTAALSILLDSTSPGPDPVALEMLGWSYGSSGIGDWDGCHYFPGEIGTTLRVLQDQVAVQYISERQEEAQNSKNRMGEKNGIKNDDLTNSNDSSNGKFGTDGPLDQNQDIWWLQDHEIKYGQGYERPATRFCTIGGVAPLASPYTHGGVIWAPPIAGVCVPSSCTSRGLYLLFDEGVGFADKLLQLSSQDGFYDDSTPGDAPPTASRRFRYMSSLAQSFVAGRKSKMGIICEGESGLPELDVEGYRSPGYYATMGLTFALLMCVIIGTLTANLPMCQIKEKDDDELEEEENEKTIRMDNRRTRTKRLKYYSYSPENTRRPSASRLMVIPSGLSTSTKQLDYGTSNSNHDSSTHSIKSAPDELSPSQDTPKGTFLSKLDQDYTEEMEEKHDYDGHVNIETTSDVASSIDIESNASSNSNDPYIKTKTRFFLRQIKSWFSVWDAAQSFYEITRMKREDDKTSKSSLHEQNLQHVGSQSLDPYSSQHGLFAISRKYSRSSFRSLVLNSPGADKQHRKSISMSSSKCLNGMRSISMLWIIFGHTLAVQSSIGYNNPAAMLPPTGMMASTLGSIILSARYAVDTFFFIGGYLVMSGLLKRLDPTLEKDYEVDIETEQIVDFWTSVMAKLRLVNLNHVVVGDYVNRLRKKKKGASASADSNSISRKKKTTKGLLWMIPFLVHRVLRILPTYGFVLLIWWKVAVTMGDGPFWPRWATLVAQCDANAWTNMLFINNLVPRNQPFGETSECMYHAWYLGVDFQLCAVLTPIFVTMFLRKGCRKFTIIIESLLVLGIVIASIICSYRYGWSAHLFDGALTGAFDRGFYINPFFRASPYIIGFITAQLWHEKCRLCPNLGLSKLPSIILSLFSIILLSFISMGTGGSEKRPCLLWESPHTSDCGSGWSVDELAVYNSFVRPAWAFGLSIMSLLSFNGQLMSLGASSVLTWNGWDPFGKLSFSMYLLHPLIINIWVLGGASKFRYSHVNFFYAFAGIVALTFLAALAVGILVEWPMSKITRNIEERLWSSSSSSGMEKNRNDVDSGIHTRMSETNSTSATHLNTSSGVSSHRNERIALNPN